MVPARPPWLDARPCWSAGIRPGGLGARKQPGAAPGPLRPPIVAVIVTDPARPGRGGLDSGLVRLARAAAADRPLVGAGGRGRHADRGLPVAAGQETTLSG